MEINYEIKNLFNELKNKSGTRIIYYLELYHELENYFDIEADDELLEKIFHYYLNIEGASDIADFVAEISRYADNLEYANEKEKEDLYDKEYQEVLDILTKFKKENM